jgi:DNA polymerase-3 subunit gamma/tau
LDKGFDGQHFINGLASHLRDLLVCKDEATLKLLEVGASVREKYKEQSKKTELPLLFRALEICNKTDLSYKASQNKRLLVELGLIQITQMRMQLATAAPTLMQAPTQVQSITTQQSQSTNTPRVSQSASPTQPQSNTPTANATETPAATSGQRTMSISLKNVGQKQESTNDGQVTESAVPQQIGNKEFTPAQVLLVWQEFAQVHLDSPRMRAIFDTNKPQILENNVLQLNTTNTIQQKAFFDILEKLQHFFCQKLDNALIKFSITLSEETAERKVFTNSDKFKFLDEKNANLSKLKGKFNLDF